VVVAQALVGPSVETVTGTTLIIEEHPASLPMTAAG
jgi:hypothetical protein